MNYLELFDKFDTYKRHALEISEAYQMFFEMQKSLERYELDYIFKHFDPTKSMQITKTGFEKYMEKRAERVS